MTYSDTDQYQKEIAEQYKKRTIKFTTGQVIHALGRLGITVDETELVEATVGNVNFTYLTPTLAIKINQKTEYQDYLANKIAADKLADNYPVPKIIAYDFFERTPFEILVMERIPGEVLVDTIFNLTEQQSIILFKQVLEIVAQLHNISFSSFGEIRSTQSFRTFTEYLLTKFKADTEKIRSEGLCSSEDLVRIENYFYSHVDIFDEASAVFVHTDVHMGNILHRGETLSGLIDFDSSLKAPSFVTLQSILKFLDHPSWFVEGTPAFAKYKGKNFHHLFPILKEKFHTIFTDPQLARKLNVYGVATSVMWVAGNWSAEWNKETIDTIVTNELADTETALEQSYYGKLLRTGFV